MNMKNIMKKKFYFIGLLVSVVVNSFSSCSDENYDFPGDSVNRVFLRNTIVPLNYQLFHTPVTSMCNLDFSTSVNTTLPATGEIKAIVGVDNSFVETYNKQKGTEYLPLPENALKIVNATMTIQKGEMSSDVMHVTLNENIVSELRAEKGYLLPLKLHAVNGSNAVVSTNVNYTCVIISTTFDKDMLKDNATDSDVQGTLVDNRDGWTARVIEENLITSETGEYSNLFDGDLTSTWQINTSGVFNLVVDMQKEQDVTAIRAAYGRLSWGSLYEYAVITKNFVIESSVDGEEWFNIGTVSSTSLANKCVVFNGPITARFIKITVPGRSNWSGNVTASIQIGEFSVFVK